MLMPHSLPFEAGKPRRPILSKYVLDQRPLGIFDYFWAYRARIMGTLESITAQLVCDEFRVDPAWMARCYDAAQRVRQINHPSLAPVYEVGMRRGVVYLL